jgi:transposase
LGAGYLHEAVRDLTRAREVAMIDLKKKRQQLLSFLLRHGRIFPGGMNWSKMHERWLAKTDLQLSSAADRFPRSP